MYQLVSRNSVSPRIKAIGLLPERLRRRVFHRLLVGRWPDLKHPSSYSEVASMALLQEDGLLASIAADKDACKTYVSGLSTDLKTPHTRWLGTDPATIPDDALEGRWVVKLNAGSGPAARGNGPGERAELEAFVRSWRSDDAVRVYGSRYYRPARDALIIEDYLDGGDARPLEVRFHCFGGTPDFVAIYDHDGDTRLECYLDADGNRMPEVTRTVNGRTFEMLSPMDTIPPHFERMREIAAKLGAGFAHVRVDLYVLGDEIWFGELTPYPHGGFVTFQPASFDRRIGKLWLDALSGSSV